MKPIKLALKNITKLNKFIFIFVNLCPWVFGSTNKEKIPFNGVMETSLLVKENEKTDGNNAYEAFLEFAWEQKDTAGLHLFFFDVGHGNFILVRNKYNAIIVDAGSNNKNTVDTYIKNLFWACLGEAHLSQIIITHDHKDHTNYVKDVKEWEEILISDQNPFHSFRVTSKQYVLIPEHLRPTDLQSPISNATLSFLKPLTVLQANSQDDEAIRKYENHRSSVFVLTYQGLNVLFTGDATGLSLDNYVEKHQGFSRYQNDIVATNRKLLENIHLFVMPHHGSFTEDSFRWALYVAKHSPGLLASVICEDPHKSGYQGLQTGLRDFPWPMSMRNDTIKNNFIYYWSRAPSQTGRTNKYDLHKRQTNAALFITGAEPCRCVYFMILEKCLYKYDSKKQGFVRLSGTGVLFNDLYEDNNEIVNTVYGEEYENTPGEIQMSNIPMNGGGFDRENSKEDSFNPSLPFTPIKKKEEKEQRVFTSRENQYVFDNRIEMVEQKEIQENGPNGNAISEDDDEENGMKEEKDMSSAFPSNVYKFQDAFDDNNDYMAYAS